MIKQMSIADFTLLSVIGKGSYAKVILVRQNDDNHVYAMKVLKKDYIEKQKQEEHITTERNVLVQADHPFVIKLYYSFQNERKLYFVLEFCQGGELFNLLSKKKCLTEDQARFYAAQMVLAIEYLHSKDIIYRDLKPENVLIDLDGYIRITDFGLSKKNVKGADAYSVCGTPEYLAPEILYKLGHGKPVDWWTLGSIIFEMVTGLPPYYSNDRQELFDKIKTQPIRFSPNVYLSPNLKSLLEKLFEKDPAQRLGSKGASEIKSDPWFQNIDWDAILNQKIIAPFRPQVKSQTDVINFDSEFVESELGSYTGDAGSLDGGKEYPKWTYNPETSVKAETDQMDVEQDVLQYE